MTFGILVLKMLDFVVLFFVVTVSEPGIPSIYIYIFVLMEGLVTCDRLCAYLLANFCLIYHRICLSSIGTRTKLIQSTRVSVYKQYEMYKCINLKHFAQIGRFLVWSFRKFAQRK